MHPIDTNVTELGALTLICEGKGYPLPEIMWFRNQSVIDPTLENNVAIISMQSTLLQKTSSNFTVSITSMNDSGIYHCTLSTNEFSVISQSAVVLVQSKYKSNTLLGS